MTPSALTRFLKDERGSIAVESMLSLPMLIWCFLGTFVFFDSFRAESTNIKAAYTIGDALSRETGYITPEYMDSLYYLMRFLIATEEDSALRVTVYSYDADEDRYTVRWSEDRGGAGKMTTAELNAARNWLPAMPETEVAILVQTGVNYAPAFKVGLDGMTYSEFVVTRPRFASQLCWNSQDNGDEDTATC